MKGKNIITLNGEWEYIKDPDGVLKFPQAKFKFENKQIDGKINLPINWELAGLHNYSGTVWFKREIYISEKDFTNNGYIEFNGVDYYCDVFFNGVNVGSNEGYFNKFEFRLTEEIFINDYNTVIIKVSSPKENPGDVWPNNKYLIKGIFNHHDCRPGGWSLEHGQDRNTGGVWNDVNLYFTKIPHPNFDIVTDYDFKVKIGILKILVYIPVDYLNAVYFKVILKKGNKYILKEDAAFKPKLDNNSFVLEYRINNPMPWSTWDVGTPNLYSLIITSEEFGEYNYSIGFKNVCENDKGELILNGKRIFVRGTNIIPEQMLSSLTNDRIDNLVRLLKEANINAVRVHAHVNRQELYDAFDKAGILVWQDFALQWTYNNSKKFIKAATIQIGEMVNLLKLHPCIAYWCCHNEPGYESGNLDNALYNEVKANDTTRIIKLYSNYEEHPYYGWYWGNKDEYVAAPMGPMVTEFGAQGIPGYDTLSKFMTKEEIEQPDWDKWAYHNYQYEQTNLIAKVPFGNNVKEYIENSQKYQAELLATAIKNYRINKYKPITGIYQFMFIDCWESITWSVVDYFGNKKKGYFTLQKMYSPFIMFVNKRQNEYMIDSFLNIDVDIVNDLYKNFYNTKLSIIYNNDEIKSINNINISEDSVFHVNWELFKIPIKEHFKAGINKIKIVLFKGKQILSEDEIEITVIDKKQYWGK